MNEIQKLRADREVAANTIKQLRDKIVAEGRDFNTEERASWDKANGDFDKLGERVSLLERAAEVESKVAERKSNKPGTEDVLPGDRLEGKTKNKRSADEIEELNAIAVQGWFLRKLGKPITDRHKRAAKLVGFDLTSKYIDVKPAKRGGQTRAQSVGTTTAGGYTVPTNLAGSIEYALKEWNAVRSVADVFSTPDGQPFDMVTVDDTSNVGTLLAENTTVGAAVDITFGKKTLNAYKFNSGLVLISAELDMDNAVGLSQQVGSILGERLGRGMEAYNTTGTGSSQPQGIVVGSTLGVTTAGATAITANEVIDLFHSVDPAYRKDPSFGFMMHDGVAKAIRKLVDSQGRYLWDLDSLRTSPGGVLLGRPVTINQSMQATVATGTKTMLAGAFKKFKIRDAGGVRIRRLDERYADIDQVGFIGLARMDSRLINAGTNPVKHMLQA